MTYVCALYIDSEVISATKCDAEYIFTIKIYVMSIL